MFDKLTKNNLLIVLFIMLVAFTIYLFNGNFERFGESSDVSSINGVGVSSSGDIWGLDGKSRKTKLPGTLINISYGRNFLFGVNANDDIYFTNVSNPKSIKWTQLPGKLVQISYDPIKNVLAGVNRNDDIYVADKNITTSPNWKNIPGKLINVSASNGKLLGVNRNNNIYFNADYNTGNWTQLSGSLKQVQYNGTLNIVVGINSNNDTYYADTNVATAPNWQNLNKKMKYVTLKNKNIIGIDLQDNLWVCDTNKKLWEQKHIIIKNLSQIDFGN